MGAWDDPSAFGLVTPQQAQAAPVAAQPSTPAADPWSNPAAFGLTPAQPAQPVAGQAAPAAQPAQPSDRPSLLTRIDQYGRSLAQGATLGWGDEIAAAGDAATHGLLGRGADGNTYNDRYNANLASEQAKDAATPSIIAVPGKIIGGIAGTVGDAPALLGRAAMAVPGMGAAAEAAAPVVNALGRVPLLKPAAVGAGYGAVAGAGDADSGNRLAGALHGAETGAVLGPIMEGGVNALGAGYGVVKNALGGLGLGQATPVADAAGNALSQPVTAAQALAAGQKIQSATSDPIAVRNALAQPTEIVPGSPVTTYQATGDQGLGSLERGVSQKDPGPFIDLRNQQNAARVSALSKSVPADASAANIGPAFSKQLADLDAQHQAAVDAAKASVGASLDAAGGTAVGGDAASAQQQYGAQLRGQLDAANQAAKAKEGALWDAVDPQGNLGVDASPIQAAAQQVLREHGQFATPLGGDEAHTLNTAADAPDQMKFSDVKDLRDQITTALPKARMAGDMQTVRRLSILLDGVHGALDGAVSDAGVSVPAAVSGGTSVSAPNVGSDVFTPSGQRVGVNYELANAPDLVTSHNADMTPNPAFPPELQPRDRDRAASAVQVANIASRLQPERLGASSTVADGAPIVGPDNVVESGNGRVLGLRQAYQANGPQAQSYRDWLASQGHDVAGMDQPVLIRRRVTDLTPDQRATFATEGNAPSTLAMSAPEQAAADAKLLTPDVLGKVQPGDVADPANRDFVRGFARNVVDPAQSGSFAAGDGSLSQQGAARMRAALVHRAYGDGGLTSSLAESTDPHAKVLAGAMQDAAGPMAQLKAGIQGGQVDPAVDLAPHLVEAAQAVQQARQRGISLADHVGQSDAFNGLSPQATRILTAAYGPQLSGQMSRAGFADMLGTYARRAEEQSTAGNLFGANLTSDQLLDGVAAQYGKTASASAGQPAYAISARRSNGQGGGQGGQLSGGQAGPGASTGGGIQGGQAGARILPHPEQPQLAPFDADAAARYAAARQATADRHATFTNAPGVGPVLQQGRWAGDFKAPDSAVPGQLFGTGRGAAEKVQSYLKAGGDPSQIAGYAAFDMRRVAANPDGTINAARLAAWQARHSEALSALPDLKQKLSTVAGAQDALDSATGAQTAAKQAFQSSAAGKFLGDVDPVKTMASILNGNKAQSQIAQLASASADPDTRAGLQKAVIDHVFSQMQGDKLAGQTGTTQLYGAQLQKFVRQKLPALREIMTPDQVDMAQKVATDIQRSDQSLSGNVLPAGSATAQNAAASSKASAGGTLLQHIRQHAAETLIGAGVGTPLGGAIGSMFGTSGAIIGSSVGGTVGGIAGKVVSGLKTANISTVDDLVKQAMLNPGLAKVLLAKVDAANAPNVGNALASQLGRVAAAGGGALAGRASN